MHSAQNPDCSNAAIEIDSAGPSSSIITAEVYKCVPNLKQHKASLSVLLLQTLPLHLLLFSLLVLLPACLLSALLPLKHM